MIIKNDLEFQIGRYQSRATCFDRILTEALAEVWMSNHVARDRGFNCRKKKHFYNLHVVKSVSICKMKWLVTNRLIVLFFNTCALLCSIRRSCSQCCHEQQRHTHSPPRHRKSCKYSIFLVSMIHFYKWRTLHLLLKILIFQNDVTNPAMCNLFWY